MTKILFQPGQVVMTQGVAAIENKPYLLTCLARHLAGDWGTNTEEGGAMNEEALELGYRIFSAYAIDPSLPAKGYGENVFWIITEADRSATTLLLPAEY